MNITLYCYYIIIIIIIIMTEFEYIARYKLYSSELL